ncbi:phage antirepressor KilAC domain-containing protein [Pseudomonas viridiflava]|uniref:phage antirepressor KilAC domain-containing protein n=1 Tax=Pseudomonas viridiflava TaxID=33069 RepID=UPI001C315913|nr:phage antirepressor KilAC domain-containing protein [Pseudomonas viridiflava]QXG49191.1 phage antirepressor KilAC domain-containing protein [Pseudomonas viridiflava]
MPISQHVVNSDRPRHEIAHSQNVARTMSSREIAELTDKAHKNVLADIRAMFADLEIDSADYSAQYQDSTGRWLPCFNLDRELTDTLLTGYSAKMRRAVVHRWHELEGARVVGTLPDFSNPAAAARAWAEQFEMQQAANQALAIAAPKAEFVDKYVESTGLKGFRQTAKLLGANEARFREFLLDKRIMYRMGGEWQAYQNHVDAGRFQVKTGTTDGGHAFNQAKFTPKGVSWIAGLWAQYQLEAQ